jgi:HlyD family secretion protein
MFIWFAIPLGMGLIAAFIAVVRHGGARGIYIGIVERRRAIGTDRDGLQVRIYVDETLARELPVPSKLTGRMFIRETDTIVPLMFDRVPPPFLSPDIERSRAWQERAGGHIVPVIFRFDPTPPLAVQPGLLVDVFVGER